MASLSKRLLAQITRDQECGNSEENSEINQNSGESASVKFQRIPGFRKNSTIVWAHEQQFLYYINAHSDKTGITACTCYDENCRARLYIKDNSTAYCNSVPHEHESHYQIYMHMYCYNLLKQKVFSAPASVSNKELYNEVIKEYVLF